MNDTRARFEEIWPVPEGIYWHDKHGCYLPYGDEDTQLLVYEWNDRLDTFTRCQETTDVYVSLVEEMVARIESEGYGHAEWFHRAKQIMEQKK